LGDHGFSISVKTKKTQQAKASRVQFTEKGTVDEDTIVEHCSHTLQKIARRRAEAAVPQPTQ
jgi:hypothetical protein